MEKRGQGLSVNAIILIVLGVVVLVVLILGFTMGWNRIAPWLSTNNVDTIVQQCSVACSTGSVYDYCSVERELKVNTKIGDLESGKKYTCDKLSEDSYSNLGVSKCSALQPCAETIPLNTP